MTLRLSAAALFLAVAAPLSACSTGAVSIDALEKTINDKLEEQIGRAPDSVDCPADLPSEVGETVTCTLTDGEETYDVDVTVTSVDGADVNFDIEVADEPS